MVFHDNFSGLLGSSTIFGVIGVLVFIFILIWMGIRNSQLSYGTAGEARAVRVLKYPWYALRWTGRKLWGTLKWGVRNSIQLSKFAYRVGKKGGKLGKDFGQYASRLIEGEKANISMELHETATGAASVELGTIIGKLANAELNEHAAMQSLEFRLRFLDNHLAGLLNIGEMDEATRKFVVGLGQQITSALIELANHENLELHQRKKSFGEVYRLLKIIKTAENLAWRIEKRAIANQKALSKYNKRELVDLKKYIDDTIKKENQKIRSAREAYRNTANADQVTKATLYNQIRLAQQTAESVRQNAARLQQILEQLQQINWRMLNILRKIINDIKLALGLIAQALAKEKELLNAEKSIERNSAGIKGASKKAESNFKTIQKEMPEEIIIGLTRDAGSILNEVSEISKFIRDIDTKDLLPLMESLYNATSQAYRVEEASRVANSFYSRLMEANDRFYQLVAEADFSQEVKATFIQEIKIEEMERQIAAQEENVAQVSKNLFIRAGNFIKNSMGRLQQHIEYLSNNIILTEQTKNYTLDILNKIMENLHAYKTKVNNEFAQKAAEYQQRLQGVRFRESVAKLAA